VKYFVIVLTVITILAFGLFTALMIQKFVFPDPSESAEENRWWVVAEKLEKDGLTEQAIDQYRIYLNHLDVKPRQRSEISFRIGKLYMRLNHCGDALPWLYHAEIGASTFPWIQEVQQNIESCRGQLQEKGK